MASSVRWASNSLGSIVPTWVPRSTPIRCRAVANSRLSRRRVEKLRLSPFVCSTAMPSGVSAAHRARAWGARYGPVKHVIPPLAPQTLSVSLVSQLHLTETAVTL